MQTSTSGRKLIESFEALRLEAYPDQKGIPTIGYGHTLDIHLGTTITQQEADDFLGIDLHIAESAIYRNVKITLNQNQFDALVSLIFNIGAGAFKDSTLLKLLNGSDFLGAANQFLVWNKINKAPSQGLTNRRIRERALFLEVPNVTGTAE